MTKPMDYLFNYRWARFSLAITMAFISVAILLILPIAIEQNPSIANPSLNTTNIFIKEAYAQGLAITVTSTPHTTTTWPGGGVAYYVRVESNITINGPLTLEIGVPTNANCVQTSNLSFTSWSHSDGDCQHFGVARYPLSPAEQLIAGQPVTMSYVVIAHNSSPTTLSQGAITLTGPNLPNTITGTSTADVTVNQTDAPLKVEKKAYLSGQEITPANRETLTASPGDVITFAYHLTNNSDDWISQIELTEKRPPELFRTRENVTLASFVFVPGQTTKILSGTDLLSNLDRYTVTESSIAYAYAYGYDVYPSSVTTATGTTQTTLPPSITFRHHVTAMTISSFKHEFDNSVETRVEVTPTTAQAGKVVTYTYRVTNTGDIKQQSIQLVDVSTLAVNPVLSKTFGTIIIITPLLLPGETFMFTRTYTPTVSDETTVQSQFNGVLSNEITIATIPTMQLQAYALGVPFAKSKIPTLVDTIQTSLLFPLPFTPLTDLAITGPTSGTLDSTYNFSLTTTPVTASLPITYNWSPVPDSGQGTDTATYSWSSTGEYTVTATAKNSNSIVTDTLVISITETPITGLTASNSSPTALGSATTLQAAVLTGDNVTYLWDFGDGTTGTGANLNHTYNAKGSYIAVVTATNSINTLVASTTITVQDVPIAGLTLTSDEPTSLGKSTAFQATVTNGTAVGYTWNFGDGTTGTGASTTHQYSEAGLYNVTVTARNGVGSQTATTEVEVYESIQGLQAFSDSPTILGSNTTLSATVASGGEVTYTWQLGDNTTATGAVIEHLYTTPGSYTATVVASNNFGAITKTIAISIAGLSDLAISKTGPTTAIANEPFEYALRVVNVGNMVATNLVITDQIPLGATYVDGGTLTGDVVEWSIPTLSANASVVVSFRVTAQETVTNNRYGVTSAEGSIASGIAVVVTEIALPVSGVTASNNSPTEIGQLTTFTATVATGDDVLFSWDFGDGSDRQDNLTANTITHEYPETGRYTATVIASNEAGVVTATTSVIVTESPIQGLAIATNSPTLLGLPTTLTASVTVGTDVAYQWDFGDGAVGVGSVVTHTYSDVGLYTATVTASNSMGDQVTATLIEVFTTPPPEVSLHITKQGPNQVTLGQPIEYLIIVTNQSEVEATNLTISDQLPENASYVNGGTLNNDTVIWQLPTLASQQAVTVSFVVTAETTITNDTYQVVADGEVEAIGKQAVTTIINPLPNPTQGNIVGVVKSTLTDETLTNIRVNLYTTNGRWWRWIQGQYTDNQGLYQFSNLPPGTYRLGFYDPQQKYQTEFYQSASNLYQATDVNLKAGEVTNLTMFLDIPSRIMGTVVDAANNPINNITVEARQIVANNNYSRWAGSTTTNTQGEYNLSGLSDGMYQIKFVDRQHPHRYPSIYYQNVFTAEMATLVTVTANTTLSNINAIMLEGGRLNGIVTDNEENPIQGIRVRLEENKGSWWGFVSETFTDANGAYELSGLNGTYRVRFMNGYYWSAPYISQIHPDITINLGETKTLSTSLDKPGQIIGTAVFTDGQPIANMQARLYKQVNGTWQNAYRYGYTDDLGQYRIDNIADGIYRVALVNRWSNQHLAYYDGAETLNQATDIIVSANTINSGIDFELPIPTPPVADITLAHGNISIDPITGQIVMWPNGGDVTVSKEVTCTDGSAPTAVTVTFGQNSYPMTLDPTTPNHYSITIPGSAINRGRTEVSLSITCAGNTETESVGIVLWDPGGIITDSETGETIAGAVVTLYNVPGWQPKDSPDDNRANTCQSHLSKEETTTWNQPAPVAEGVLALTDSGTFDPAVNPQITTAEGRYAWDVAEGCWYVEVQADGYLSIVSPVVGVPPEVTDLDIALTPIPMIRFSQLSYAISEGVGAVTITVTTGTPVTQTTTVDYDILGGSAQPETDYQPISGSLTFEVGETTQQIILSLVDDTQTEPVETVTLALSNANGTLLGLANETIVTIIDDDDQRTQQIYLPLLHK